MSIQYFNFCLLILKQCVEPLEELREDSVAAEDLSPVENTTGNLELCFCH